MRVLITGIEGFVGRHLAAALASVGYEVAGTALSPAAAEGPWRVIELDVGDPDRVARVIDEEHADAIVHLAGRASVADSFREPVVTYEVNLGGALHLLEACRRTGVGRLLLVTSCEIYGELDPMDGPVAEQRTMAPVSPYGGSKAAQDLLGEQYARAFGLPVVRARSFPHTGPGQQESYLFPSVARRVAEAEAGLGPPTIKVGNVDVVRDLLDVRDVARAYVLLLERGRPGEAYNVCSGRGRTLRDSLAGLCRLARLPVHLESDPSRERPADIPW
ncbi:MAG TPA: NAD-dependent epimerase/dehydratase family protein, partial [Actinomycetota bacterium]|nr:NAD-dependent epimerase/dehydratase family protein [Actinomycetota bacterium]